MSLNCQKNYNKKCIVQNARLHIRGICSNRLHLCVLHYALNGKSIISVFPEWPCFQPHIRVC